MGRSPQGLQRIASDSFSLSGDVHRLITFLNQSLKDRGIIFGLTKAGSGYGVAIYTTNEYQSDEGEGNAAETDIRP